MDCHPGNVLLIGDTLHDYEVARDTEIECVLVVSGHQSRERLERTGCPVFDSLEHVMRMWHVASASKAGSSCTPTNKMS
jgi:phosphoglycolate phosphatase-like HAD superfamily hydrolase